MFQVENLFFPSCSRILLKKLRAMGFWSLYVILDSQFCFSNPLAVGDDSGWKVTRGSFKNGKCWEAQQRPQTPDVQKCLMTCGTCEMPTLMCCRAAFVCVDDLFCGCRSKNSCLNQLRKKRHLRSWMCLTPKHGHLQFCFCIAVNTEPCREYQS